MTKQSKQDTAPDLEPARQQAVRREMVRWYATNFDGNRKRVSLRHYLVNTVSVYAIAQHHKSGGYYGAA